MTISAGKGLVGGCIVLYLGSTAKAFVTPPVPATKVTASRRVSTTTTVSLFGAGAAAATPQQQQQQQQQTDGSARRKRGRAAVAPLHASLQPASTPREGGWSPAIPRGRSAFSGNGAAAGGPRFMTNGAAPVDAELSDPAAAQKDGNGGSGGGGGGGGGGGTGGGEESGAVPAGDPATRTALKQKLLGKVATLNRGFVAQEADRVDVEEIIEMLEMENPNPKSCEAFESGSSPLAGRWKLLYTTSLDVLSLQINPAVTVGQIFQEIEEDGRGIQNIIELQPPFAAVNKVLGSSMATLTVKLETEPVSSSRINLKFVRTEVKADSLFGRKLDLPTLGVNIPSPESFEKLLLKGKGKDLKNEVNAAKKKARSLVQKVKGDKEEEEKEEGGEGASASATEDKNVDGGATDGGEDTDAGGEGEQESGGGDDAGASPGSSSSLRTPYFESTYVDEDLRVGRTGQGDVFVSVRA